MIRSFGCRETEKIWEGRASRRLPGAIQERALLKLRQLDAAMTVGDLKIPPSNHLEALRGNRKGQMSIRINNQWRICFQWGDGEATDVEIVDYH
jgi:proteic killer suppression protein